MLLLGHGTSLEPKYVLMDNLTLIFMSHIIVVTNYDWNATYLIFQRETLKMRVI